MIIDKLGDKPKREQLDEHSFFVGVHENEEGKETVVLYPQSEVLKTSETARKYAVESKEAAENAIETGKEIIYQSTKATGANVDIPTEVFKYASITVIEGCAKAEDKRLEPSGINIISNGNSYSMPEQVTSLPNYGYGAGEGYNNTVDFENGKYTQSCAVFEPINVGYATYTYFQGLTFDFPISRYDKYVKAIETVKCSHSELTFSYYNVQWLDDEGGETEKEEATISDGMLRVKLNGNDPTEEELQSFIDAQRTAGTPVVICYGLPDPIEKDITDIASKIDLIVTPSGIVTFDGAVGTLEMFVPKKFASEKYVNNTTANAIHGTLRGVSVSADDVSPNEHELDIWVHGKNLLKPSCTYGTIVAASGKISTQTTASVVSDFIYLRKGDYFISYKSTVDLRGVAFYKEKNEESFITYDWAQRPSTFKYSFVVNESCFVRIDVESDGYVAIENIDTFFEENEVQLEKGSSKTDYVSYVDVANTSVNMFGKNLSQLSSISFPSSANSIIYEGRLPIGAVLSRKINFTKRNNVLFQVTDMETNSETTFTDSDDYINILPQSNKVRIELVPNGRTSGTVSEIQLEIGSDTPTVYTPFISPIQGKVNAEGEVKGIISLAPNMTLTTDNVGAVIECGYVKDTNKVIENLENLINAITISLGGNI